MNKRHFILTNLLLAISFSGLTAQVTKQIYVDKAGTLISNLTEQEAMTVTHLTITGKINAVDFKNIRDGFWQLESLNISNAEIRTYAGKNGTYPEDKFYVYPPNCVPAYAFCTMVNGVAKGKSTLKEIYLSEKVRNIEDAAFKGCENLYICHINRKTPPNLLQDGLSDTLTAVFIPAGSRDQYRYKKNWENFVLIEDTPVSLTLTVGPQDNLQDVVQRQGVHPKDINFLVIQGKLDDTDLKLISDYMNNLVSLDIENTTATSLPNFTFAQKKNLLRIKLPKGLLTIGQRAFSGCERLNGDLLLPEGVTNIEYGAFLGCTNLKQVIVTGRNLTSLGNNLFGDEKSKLVYYYPVN